MLIPKRSYAGLKDSYLFYNIAQKVNAYAKENPGCKLYRLGVGDVTQPLSPSVIAALREGVEDQSKAETFHGYAGMRRAVFEGGNRQILPCPRRRYSG